MSTKYTFTGATKSIGQYTLHQIRAARDFGNVKSGAVGGYIEKESNLSHDGNAWVYGNAMVFEDAQVIDNAEVYDNARVFGDVIVMDNAKVFGTAGLGSHGWVCGGAEVSGDTNGYTEVVIGGNAKVHGHPRVGGEAAIYRSDHILVVGPLGSRGDYTTFFHTRDHTVAVRCGCYCGTLDEFIERVTEVHGDSKYGVTYRAAAELARQCVATE